jgi:hypothetical protein
VFYKCRDLGKFWLFLAHFNTLFHTRGRMGVEGGGEIVEVYL